MCERLLNLQEIYVSGQNICIEVYGNSVGTITPNETACLSCRNYTETGGHNNAFYSRALSKRNIFQYLHRDTVSY